MPGTQGWERATVPVPGLRLVLRPRNRTATRGDTLTPAPRSGTCPPPLAFGEPCGAQPSEYTHWHLRQPCSEGQEGCGCCGCSRQPRVFYGAVGMGWQREALHGAAVCPASCCSLPVLATAPWSWVMEGCSPGCPPHPGPFWGAGGGTECSVGNVPAAQRAPSPGRAGHRWQGEWCRL